MIDFLAFVSACIIVGADGMPSSIGAADGMLLFSSALVSVGLSSSLKMSLRVELSASGISLSWQCESGTTLS